MAQAKVKENPWDAEKPYPTPAGTYYGCKVSWNYYDTEDEALVCSVAARYNAVIAEGQGYDFGHCCPGSVCQVPYDDGVPNEHAGRWVVCLP